MSDLTPSPAMRHKVPRSSRNHSLTQLRSVAAVNGIKWIIDAFELFTRSAGTWILIALFLGFMFYAWILLTFFSMLLGLSTPLSIAGSIITSILIGGLMLGCNTQRQDHALTFSHLFAGFDRHGGALSAVGLFYWLGTVAIFLTVFSIVIQTGHGQVPALAAGGDVNPLAHMQTEFLSTLLLALAATIPMLMAACLAPALVVLGHRTAFQAMGLSFKACLVNILPILLWAVVTLVLLLIGLMTLGIALIVIGPVLLISMFTAYQDIFSSP